MAAQSAHDQRELLRTRQRSVRLVLNTYQSISAEWKAKTSEGRQAANAAADSLLQLRYLPFRPLGVLESFSGLRGLASSKLRCQLWDNVRQTAAVTHELLGTARRIRQVIDIYFGPSEEGSRQVITMPERPVFATISWSQIGQWMHELADSYGKEALAKSVIADGLTQMAGQYCPMLLSEAREAEPLDDEDDDAVRNRLECYLANWSLDLELDEPTISSHISDITEDMRTF